MAAACCGTAAGFTGTGNIKSRDAPGNLAQVGVHVYVSEDFYNWRDAGIAFDVRNSGDPLLRPGCVIERPKVLFCPGTGRFVMYFHFEKDDTYQDAAVGIAVADRRPDRSGSSG